MKTIQLMFVIPAAACLTGCVSSSLGDLPVEARGVVLSPVSSTILEVRAPLLRQKEGRLELLGAVTKVYGSASTEKSHLDVSFLGPSGEPLQRRTAQFAPPQLARDRHSPNRQGWYSVPIDVLPSGTARIEVRAHDAPLHPP